MPGQGLCLCSVARCPLLSQTHHERNSGLRTYRNLPGSSTWFGEQWVVLPAALRTAQGGHPEPAVPPHWGAESRTSGSWVRVGGSCRPFCGRGDNTVAGRLCEPTCTCKSFPDGSPPQSGWGACTSRLLPGDSSKLSQGWARHWLSPIVHPWASAVEKLVFFFVCFFCSSPLPRQALSDFCSWVFIAFLFLFLFFLCHYNMKSHGLFPERQRNLSAQATQLCGEYNCNKVIPVCAVS